MAKVKQVFLCPKCGTELETEKQVSCNYCKAVLHPIENAFFEAPDYIWNQLNETISRIDEYEKSDVKKERDAEKLKRNMDLYFQISCTDEDRLNAIIDANLVVQNLILSIASPDTIKNIVKVGKRIGEQCTLIDNYIKAGGNINGRPTTITEPSDDPESIDQTV